MTDLCHTGRLLAVVVMAICALALSGCGDSPGEEGGDDAQAKVEPLGDTGVSSVTLTEDAAKRLGIQTAIVRRGAARRTVVPYGAVLYDAGGATFMYTSPKPRVFVRAPITVLRIDGADAVLSRGPPVGTAVVTVGSQELYGSEYAVEED
jgi:hypothetical protein